MERIYFLFRFKVIGEYNIMDRIKEQFTLNKNVTESQLKEAGFVKGIYRTNIHKDLIFLKITIEDNEWWTYQILNNDKHNTLYIPYYNRLTGKNELVDKFDKKLYKIFTHLTAQGIFERVNNA